MAIKKPISLMDLLEDDEDLEDMYSDAFNTLTSKNKIVLFGFDGCPACRNAKKSLDAAGKSYHYVDVTKQRQYNRDLLARNGRVGVPQVAVNGVMYQGVGQALK